MILFDAIAQIGTLPNANGFQITPRLVLESVYGIAGQNGFPVRLTAVDHNPLRPTMPFEGLAQEPFGGSQVAALAEPELDGVAVAVDGEVEIRPPPTHLDIRHIHMPFPADGSLAAIDPLETLG